MRTKRAKVGVAPTRGWSRAKRRAMAGRIVLALIESACAQAKVAQAQMMVASPVERAMAMARAIIEGAAAVHQSLGAASVRPIPNHPPR